MTISQSPSNASAIDSAFVARVVREVIARLQQDKAIGSTNENRSGITIDCKIIDAGVIAKIADHGSITIASGSIVTPAAKDAARERGIQIRVGKSEPPRTNAVDLASHETWISDVSQPERAQSIVNQLARRGIASFTGQVVLSEQPANEVFSQCGRGRRAVAISRIEDIARFATEFSPQVWVLDVQRMNFVSTVNAVAQIARLEKK